MKKNILLTTFSILFLSQTFACDICGGGTGSYYTGLLPQFNKKLIGLRYQYNHLYTQLDVMGNKTALSNKEQYNTIDLWGAWNIGNKWRVMAIIPYSFIQKDHLGTNQIYNKNGLSDIAAYAYYNLLQTSNNSIKQSIWAGAGVKLPTGKYNNAEVVNNAANIFQLGTGSTDFNTQIIYDINYLNWGINSTLNYKINTENTDDYRYGNKSTANLTAYYKFSLKSTSLLIPNIGIQYENQQKDKVMKYTVDQTGGNILQGSIGLETSFNKIAIGLNFQQPLAQNIASNRVELKNKLMTHISFAF